MGIDGGEKRRPNAVVRILMIRDVPSRSWVAKLLGETEVNDIDDIRGTVGAHDEISRFDVAVYDMVGMDELYPCDLHSDELPGWSRRKKD